MLEKGIYPGRARVDWARLHVGCVTSPSVEPPLLPPLARCFVGLGSGI